MKKETITVFGVSIKIQLHIINSNKERANNIMGLFVIAQLH